jgi:hypothetical protein
LNLYYAVQNLAAIPQQWIIARERARAVGPSVIQRVEPARSITGGKRT